MFESRGRGGDGDGDAVVRRSWPYGEPIKVMPLSWSDLNDRTSRNPWRRPVPLAVYQADRHAGAAAAAALDAQAGPGAARVVDDFEAEFGFPLPEAPADLLAEPEGWLAEQDELITAWLDAMSPQERFEREFGVPATPEALVGFTSVTQEHAAALQDRAVQANRVRTIADAHRVAVLIEAHDASIADLTARFGAEVGAAGGMGGTAFATTTALLTGADPRHVAHEITLGITLRDRLPNTWAAFQSGAASWSRAQKVVKEADGLDAEHWAAYDERAARIVITSHRVKADLRRERERLQDDTAARRARTTFERRHTALELGPDSGVAFVAEGLASAWVPINDGIHRAAVAAHGLDGETRTVAQLRHDITLDLLDEGLRRAADDGSGARVPQRKAVQVQLILTVPALAWLGRTKEQAILGGYGPIAMEQAKDLAADARSFIRVLTDPTTGVRLTMDRTMRKPPADLARWVRIRDGRTRFPGRNVPAHLADIDHARAWQDLGPTDEDNLITLDRPSHNAKSAGLYEESLLDSGIVGWTDAWGHRFEDPPEDPLDPAPPELLPPPAPDDGACPF